MNEKLRELLQNLVLGTQAGTLKWTDTPEKGVYRLMLDKGLIRIYTLGPMSPGEYFIGCTVLNSEGNVLHDMQVPQNKGGSLVMLYEIVDGSFQEGALDDLLAELRMKMEERSRQTAVGIQ